MKSTLLILFFVCSIGFVQAQVSAVPPIATLPKIYDPSIDAKAELSKALKEAKTEHKNVVLMIGGNWCRWCIMFQKFITADAQIDSTIKSGFIFEHLNYSKENKNLDLLAELQYPQRFGFPVFVILDENGKYLHTQNSAYLEDGEGYSKEKVIEFFNHWNPAALDPKNYVEKK